jgi:hypothetical protein
VSRFGKDANVERALEQRATEEKRQWSGSTPTEDAVERALESDEPTGQQGAGAAREDPNDVPHTGGNPT